MIRSPAFISRRLTPGDLTCRWKSLLVVQRLINSLPKFLPNSQQFSQVTSPFLSSPPLFLLFSLSLPFLSLPFFSNQSVYFYFCQCFSRYSISMYSCMSFLLLYIWLSVYICVYVYLSLVFYYHIPKPANSVI